MKIKILLLLILVLLPIFIPIVNSQEYYKLDAYSYPLEAGIVKGGGRYPRGDLVKLEAIENEGWVFNCWIIEKGDTILNLNGSNANPLYFYIYEDVKIKALFRKFEEYYAKIIVRANISYIDIKHPEKAEKGSYISLVAPEIYEISDKERYVFAEWKGDIYSNYSKIMVYVNKSLNIIAGYVKEIKFIDGEWYKENEYVKLKSTPTLITENEREIVEYWKIKSLNATLYPYNSSIPSKYLNDIEVFSIKQYLIKFLFEGKEENFKIYLENQTINAIPFNNTYEIWIDEGKILRAEFIEPSFYKLSTPKQLSLRIDSPRVFYVKYEYVSPFITFLSYIYYFFTTSIFDQLHNIDPHTFLPIPELFFLNPIVIIASLIAIKIAHGKYKAYIIKKEYLEAIERKRESFERLISTTEARGIKEFTEIQIGIDKFGEEKTIRVPEELIDLAKSQGYSSKGIIELAKYYEEKQKEKEEVKVLKNCPYCNAEISIEAKYCYKCGKAIEEIEEKKEEVIEEKPKSEEYEKAEKIIKGEEKGTIEITDSLLFEISKEYDINYLRNILNIYEYEIKLKNPNIFINKEAYNKINKLLEKESFAIIGKNCNIILNNVLINREIPCISVDCKNGIEGFKEGFPKEISSKLKNIDEAINSIPLLSNYGYKVVILYNIDYLSENEINRIVRAFNRIPEIKLVITSETREIPDIENIYAEELKDEECKWIIFAKALQKGIILQEEIENRILEYSKEFPNRIDIINEIIDNMTLGTLEEVNNIISEIEKRKEEEIIKSFNPIEKQVYDWLLKNKLASEEELQDYFFSLYSSQGTSRSRMYKAYNEFWEKLYKLGFKEKIVKSKLLEALK